MHNVNLYDFKCFIKEKYDNEIKDVLYADLSIKCYRYKDNCNEIAEVYEEKRYLKDPGYEVIFSDMEKMYKTICVGHLNTYVTLFVHSPNVSIQYGINATTAEEYLECLRLKQEYYYKPTVQKFHKIISDDNEVVKRNLTKDIKELDPLNRIIPLNYTKDYSVTELKSIKSKLQTYDNLMESCYNRHVVYKRVSIFHMITGMSAFLWIPIVIGFITGSGDFISRCLDAFGVLCLSSFIMPVTLPLSFVWGLLIKPYIIRKLMFEEPDCYDHKDYKNIPRNFDRCYYDDIAAGCGFSKSDVTTGAATALSVTALNSLIK